MIWVFAALLLIHATHADDSQQENKDKTQSSAPTGRQLPFFGDLTVHPYANENPYLNPQLQFYPNQENQGIPQVVYIARGAPEQPSIYPAHQPYQPRHNFPNESPQFVGVPQSYPAQQPLPVGQQPYPPVQPPFQPQHFPQGGLLPGNFLIPQPVDPSVYRNQIYPQRPVFSYPKPAFQPPIENDAEEFPVSGKGVPLKRPQAPQKLELDGSDEIPKNDKPAKKRPKKPVYPTLNPGQRFFILNGQPLFNFPVYQNPYLTRAEQPQVIFNPFVQQPQYGPLRQYPLQNLFIRKDVKPQGDGKQNHFVTKLDYEDKSGVLLTDNLPLHLQNQVINEDVVPVVLKGEAIKEDPQSRYLEKRLPSGNDQAVPVYEGNVNPGIAYYRYNDDDDDDAIVIDAKLQDNNEEEADEESENSNTEKPAESSMAQAQPGAIALAGNGGVAAAGPRGTALVGAGGLAISSPHATAVAGPSKDDEPQSDKKKAKKQ